MRGERIVMIAFLLGASAGVAAAQQPTLSDVAACNEAATARTESPSALPVPDRPAKGPPPRPEARGGVLAGQPGAAQEAPAPISPPAGEKTDPTGSIVTKSPDPLSEGMDASKASDPEYRAAFRECMDRRSGSAR